MTTDDQKRLEHADRLVRVLAGLPCFNPIEVYGQKTDCGEVLVCGGKCVRCAAVLYVERYEEPVAGKKK